MQATRRSNQVRVAVLAALLAFTGVAMAKSAQTHHCKMPDGTMDMSKTHKACTAAKGTWAKDADAAKDASKDAAKDAAKDMPKAASK
jgi:hypothetical protein